MAWDPQVYLSFESERTRPAAELLARISLETPAYVVDLGCGPGNSTSLLASRWPAARMDGVDNSAEMLARARASMVHAQWIEADIAHWRPEPPPDVIFSNAALQWVPDHVRLLPRLMEELGSGGVLAFQVPYNFDEPCHAVLRELEQDERWKKSLSGLGNRWHVLPSERYFDILEPHAVKLDIWQTRYLQLLEGDDPVFRWMSGTGLRPFAAALEADAREELLAAYRTRMAQAYPRHASGKTLYPFQRLFVVAQR